MRARMLLPALLALVALAACGEKTKDVDGSGSTSTPTPGAGGTASPGTGTCDVQVSGKSGAKPVVTIATCPRQTQLSAKDVTAGSGAEAKSGSNITVHYVGIAASNKKQFDASWDGSKPFGPFQIGAGNVIKGWDQGVVGMKVGGRRLLVIPPELGYGEAGAGGAIGPNETLIFVVDLLAVA